MTEKELHKLHRQDLLQLLLAQGKETAQLESQLKETEGTLAQMEATYDRLKSKLDDKDAQIDRLKTRLDEKDVKIRDLRADVEDLRENRKVQLEEIISVLKLNNLIEVVQSAANQYLMETPKKRSAIESGDEVQMIEAPEMEPTENVIDVEPEETGEEAKDVVEQDHEMDPETDGEKEAFAEEAPLAEELIEESPIEEAPLSEELIEESPIAEEPMEEEPLEESPMEEETAPVNHFADIQAAFAAMLRRKGQPPEEKTVPEEPEEEWTGEESFPEEPEEEWTEEETVPEEPEEEWTEEESFPEEPEEEWTEWTIVNKVDK